MATFIIAKVIIILLENLNGLKVFMPTTKNNKTSVYIAGYILKAATNSPCSNNEKLRCKPQPIHSAPNSFLFKQGNMYFSNSLINNT